MAQDTLNKSIIVAVGRSGTTIIHRLMLEIYVDRFGKDFDCLYEPFVWDSAAIGHYPLDGARESQFGRRDAMSEEGLYLHTKTPLFADGALPADTERQLASYLKSDTKKPLLAKFIRANGRLSVLDRLYPDGRFVLTVRNPLDVVNSVLTKFSFFGAEFHKNDYPRFVADIARLHGIKLEPEHVLPAAYRAGLWCHFMNQYALRHAAGKPNYKVVVYEDFTKNREAYTRAICEHIGTPYKNAYGAATVKPVGKVTHGAPALARSDLEALKPLFDQYVTMIESVPQMSKFDAQSVLKKYAPEHLRQTPVEERGVGWSPVKLESELIAAGRALGQHANQTRTRVADVQRMTLAVETPRAAANVPVSVVITSFNNANTLRRAVDSIRRQTYPVAEILVADDGSNDGSRTMIEGVAREESRLRLLLREKNIGVSANRKDAVRQAQSPFVSHVDGDDAFHPTKIEREVRALQGREDSVAFSDTLKLDPDDYWDCSWLTGLSGRAAVAGMVSRQAPLPRDMLIPRALFLSAGGFREDCSIYEDWGFKVRLADKAKHWLYSGGPGTLYRPGGLSRVAQINHVHGGLWILCNDVADVVARNHVNAAALAGLLRLMGARVDLSNLDQMEEALGLKITSILDTARHELVNEKIEAYAGKEQAFFDRLHRLLTTVGYAPAVT